MIQSNNMSEIERELSNLLINDNHLTLEQRIQKRLKEIRESRVNENHTSESHINKNHINDNHTSKSHISENHINENHINKNYIEKEKIKHKSLFNINFSLFQKITVFNILLFFFLFGVCFGTATWGNKDIYMDVVVLSIVSYTISFIISIVLLIISKLIEY